MYHYSVKEINKIVDGDTVDCTIDLGFGISCKQRLRLHGIDAPELNTKDYRERTLAEGSSSFLSRWINDNKNNLIVQTFKDDKYGRMLAKFITTDGRCVNDEMIKLGYAWHYDGSVRTKDFDAMEALRKQSMTIIN